MTKKKLSIILLSYYSRGKLSSVYGQLNPLLESEKIDHEFIIMDDGSKDDTFDIAKNLEEAQPKVKAYQLSRNYTSHYSIFAGLSVCTGDCAVVIPDDEQQPYQTVVDMYRLWEKGGKIIIPHRMDRDDPFIAKTFSKLFYSLMNMLSDITYPKGGADTFFIDREIINILNNDIHPINTTTITEILRLGFEPIYIPYKRVKGINEKSRWSFKKKIKLATDTFFSCSSFPIKFISYTGLFFATTSFFIIIFYGYVKLFGNNEFWGVDVAGWTSLVFFISFFSGMILFSLGIIAEYIWRIYEEVKSRPGYIIKK